MSNNYISKTDRWFVRGYEGLNNILEKRLKEEELKMDDGNISVLEVQHRRLGELIAKLKVKG